MTEKTLPLPPDPPLTERAYRYLAEVIYRRSRIRLGPDRRAFMAGRLAAFYEAMEGKRARVDWSQAGPSSVSYLLAAE